MVYSYYLYRVLQIHIIFNNHPKTDQTAGNGKEKNKKPIKKSKLIYYRDFTRVISILI
jgi:hypothetical protein